MDIANTRLHLTRKSRSPTVLLPLIDGSRDCTQTRLLTFRCSSIRLGWPATFMTPGLFPTHLPSIENRSFSMISYMFTHKQFSIPCNWSNLGPCEISPGITTRIGLPGWVSKVFTKNFRTSEYPMFLFPLTMSIISSFPSLDANISNMCSTLDLLVGTFGAPTHIARRGRFQSPA